MPARQTDERPHEGATCHRWVPIVVARAVTTARATHHNSGWALLDARRETNIPPAKRPADELPAELRGVEPEARAALIEKAARSLADSVTPASLKFTRDRHGGVWVGWSDQALTFLVHCPDRDDFSALVRTLHHHGWSSAVHSSIPLVEYQVAAV